MLKWIKKFRRKKKLPDDSTPWIPSRERTEAEDKQVEELMERLHKRKIESQIRADVAGGQKIIRG